jgi:SAM-dependent methyltransferase
MNNNKNILMDNTDIQEGGATAINGGKDVIKGGSASQGGSVGDTAGGDIHKTQIIFNLPTKENTGKETILQQDLLPKPLQSKPPAPQVPDPLTKTELEKYKLKLTCYNFDNNAENYDDALKGNESSMQRGNLIRLLWMLRNLLKTRFKGWQPYSWLDAGCGTGLMPIVSKQSKNKNCCRWIFESDIRAGFDNASHMVECAKKIKGKLGYTHVFEEDLLKITPDVLEQKTGKSYVDLIIANNVIHWLFTTDNIDKALINIRNILNPKRGIFAASIAAEGTASTFLRSYKTTMEEEMNNYMPTNKVHVWESHLCNPIGLQTVGEIVKKVNENDFRVEILRYVYEPCVYEGGTDDYVDDVRAYGEYIYMAPLLSYTNDETREKIWKKIKIQFNKDYHEKFDHNEYVHDQYMLYLIISNYGEIT